MDRPNIKICYRCMRKSNTGICPWCGFDAEHYELPEEHLPPMTVLHDKYLLGVSIGRGGFGITYIAYDLHLQVIVAVKELFLRQICSRLAEGQVTVSSKDRECFEENREQFLQEARVLAMLREETRGAVVSVNEHFEERGTAYLVMEYLEGKTLREYVAERKLSFSKIQTLLEPVANALTLLHEQGLVHRDISPDNIMVLQNGEIRLLDFGGAAEYESGEAASIVSFKRGYAPPEQYRAGSRIGPSADVYSLAATFCYCITGKRPPDADKPEELQNWNLAKDSGRRLSKEKVRVLLTAMNADPVRRYRSIPEFWSILTKRSNHRPRLAVVSAVAGILAGVIGITMVRMREPRAAYLPIPNGIYRIQNAQNPQEHLAVEGGYADNGTRVILTTEKTGNSSLFSLESYGESEAGFFTLAACHTGSSVLWQEEEAGEEERLVQSQMGEEEPNVFRFLQSGRTEKGMPYGTLEDEKGRCLAFSEEDLGLVPLKKGEEEEAMNWILVPTEADSSEPLQEVYEVGSAISGLTGQWELSPAQEESLALAAQLNLMDEPPTLLLGEKKSTLAKTWILQEFEDGIYSFCADPVSVGAQSFLEENPENGALSLTEANRSTRQQFCLRYAGQNTWYIEAEDGSILTAYPELIERGALSVALVPKERFSGEPCRWKLTRL